MLELNLELLHIVKLEKKRGYGLYYNKSCIYTNKSEKTVREQQAILMTYSVSIYRRIGDMYARLGRPHNYNKWFKLFDLLQVIIKHDGDTTKCFLESADLSRINLEITEGHLYYTDNTLLKR